MSDFSKAVLSPETSLRGPALVEASAGTGKTYNIQNAYLRLILEAGFTVEQILVVTFTEAATHELRERLRRILHKCQAYLEDQLDADDADYARIRDLVDLPTADGKPAVRQEALARVRLALVSFDNAAISTIHGFCHRVLERYAFECGHDPEAELTGDRASLVERLCQDWWRRETYVRAGSRGRAPFANERELTAYLNEYLKRSDAELRPRDLDDSTWEDDVASCADAIRTWLKRCAEAGAAYGKPNAAARRLSETLLPDLLKALESETAGRNEVRRQMKAAEDDLAAGIWKREASDFPASFRPLVDACRSSLSALGSLRGSIRWEGRQVLQRGTDTRVVVKDVAAAAACARKEGVDEWLAHPEPAIKGNAGARNMLEALRALCDPDLAWPKEGDARGFCKHLKTLGEAEPDKFFQPSALTLVDLAPEIAGTVARLQEGILADMAAILVSLAREARSAVQREGTMTYDDLLRGVRDALRDQGTADTLRTALREEYHAALVDEFQDTDPVQFEIFARLFPAAVDPLLFVGDPKQAIYGFRGGDVFTYYAAKAAVPASRHFSLGTNYRCEANLLCAVNALFKDGASPTFRHAAIPYAGDLEAHDVAADRALLVDGRRDPAPLKLWRYPAEGAVPGADSEKARQVYADVADEIVSLVMDPSLSLRGSKLQPSDIAVLVCTHREADHIYQALVNRNVPAVRQSNGNVFDTEEAAEMALVVEAMLRPGDARAVRGALCTRLLPCTDDALYAWSRADAVPGRTAAESMEDEPLSLEAWMELFREAGEHWRRRSFIEGFRHLLDCAGMRAHIVGLGEGRRVLTNVLHMAELAHQVAIARQRGPAGLMRWLARQVDPATREESDEQDARLVSDDPAVQIMTIFKSKGLEFPVVFAPTLWRQRARARRNDQKLIYYHDAQHDDQPVLSLRTHDREAERAALEESTQESIRLIYVALTRAINRTYVVDIGGGEAEKGYTLRPLLSRWGEDGDEAGTSCVEQIAKAGEAVPTEMPNEAVAGDADLRTYDAWTGLAPHVDKTHGHASFTDLAPGGHVAMSLGLRDVDGADAPAEPETGGQGFETDIFSIPGGERTGNCWHDIFERLDFLATPEEQDEIVHEEVARYGICRGPTDEITQGRTQAVREMVHRVLDADLGTVSPGRPLRFRDVPMNARRSEFAFNFSLRQTGAGQRTPAIRDVLEAHWGQDAARVRFVERLNAWDRDLPLGFMTGFIDLLFCHEDRFYIVDWKSNRRGGRREDFDPSGLVDEMQRHAYFLQYLIYTVAIHRFLALSIEGYEYDRHFGGVYYLFLRGVGASPGSGIFADRPSSSLINDLSDVLTGAGS